MADTRTKNASRNFAFGLALKAYQIVVPFLIRTAIMYYMGMNYLGLNSFFTSVLLALNLAELGVGSAMVYSMYLPIVENDTKMICALLNLYRKYYFAIGAFIGAVGMALSPVIPHLAKKDVPEDVNILVVYWLNLLATVLSYWMFAYKNSLLVAHQRNDISSKVMLVTNTLMYVIQFYVVMGLKSYYVYLIVQICTQVATNVLTAVIASKKYPDYKPVGKLSKEQMSAINGKIRDLFTMKIGMIIVTSADSLVISAYLGLTVLAVYQNYFMILTAVMEAIKVLYNSVLSGIGNSIITETPEKNYKDLKKLSFIAFWMVGFCAAEFLALFQGFMLLWTKSADNLLGFGMVVAFVVYFFVDQANQILITFKDAAGIWHEDRFRPVITAGANLILNVIMVQFMGLYGIILSTVVSVVFVGMPWLIHNLFTLLFKRDAREYVWKLFFYAIVITGVCAVNYAIVRFIPDSGWLWLVARGAATAVISNILLAGALYVLEEFAQVKDIARRVIKRKV